MSFDTFWWCHSVSICECVCLCRVTSSDHGLVSQPQTLGIMFLGVNMAVDVMSMITKKKVMMTAIISSIVITTVIVIVAV